MDGSLPPRAHRVTVLGSTRSIAATSAGVRRRLSGLIWVRTTPGPLALGGNGQVTERDDPRALLTENALSQDVTSPSDMPTFRLAREENSSRRSGMSVPAGRLAQSGGLLAERV